MTDSEALDRWADYHPAAMCEACGAYDNWYREVADRVNMFFLREEELCCGVCGARIKEPERWHLHFEDREIVF